MEAVEVNLPIKPHIFIFRRIEAQITMPQAEGQMNAADFNAVGSHNDGGIGSRCPRPRLKSVARELRARPKMKLACDSGPFHAELYVVAQLFRQRAEHRCYRAIGEGRVQLCSFVEDADSIRISRNFAAPG